MNIEDQIVSLELAKKLKEIGVKQESLFYWHKYRYKSWYSNTLRDCYLVVRSADEIEKSHEGVVRKIASAFTVAELGEILTNIHGRWSSGTLNEPDTDDRYICEWYDRYGVEYWTCGKTEAEARAKAIIWLKEKDGR